MSEPVKTPVTDLGQLERIITGAMYAMRRPPRGAEGRIAEQAVSLRFAFESLMIVIARRCGGDIDQLAAATRVARLGAEQPGWGAEYGL